MEGMGNEKLYFLLLKSIKRKKKPSLGRSVSTHFVADCSPACIALTKILVSFADCFQQEGTGDPKVLFFSDKEFNGSTAGKYFVIIEYNGTVSGAEAPTEQRSVALPPTSGHIMINDD